MIELLNFQKMGGLIPAIVQDAATRQVLMLGFMNREAVEKTLRDGTATFWSRTRQRLWQKGESSGNFLKVASVKPDCDGDTLLIEAYPAGPVCHTGEYTCFGEAKSTQKRPVLQRLEETIRKRHEAMPEGSYTTKLFQEGTGRIAQKVGEEAVETVVAALQQNREDLRQESADLLYHLLVLLEDRGVTMAEIEGVLEQRMHLPAGQPPPSA
jgi:phosphoribosyl-ATP pyrophosphohydrolase/phosphoribosyl-AMP cyclohydrolase